LHVAHAPNRFDELKEEAAFLDGKFGLPVSLLSRAEVAERYYDSTEQFGALHLAKGFGLQPLNFARGLAAAAARHGARLHGRSAVVSWEKTGDTHRLVTEQGSLRARRVIVATNGFTRPDLDRNIAARLMPVVSNIIVTRPLSEAELAAQNWRTEDPCSNTRNLLFYYRLLTDRRFLFGARGDLSGSPKGALRRRAAMTRRLGEVFPHWRDVPITHYWRGLVCMTSRLTPAIGQMPDDGSIYFALAYHGDGVAAAPWAGRQLAQTIGGATSFDDIPAPYRGLPPRFPLPSFKRWYLGAALGYYWLQDK
jgi:glycine/D-amino acid oxidase-like deaminating enzyme